jgi:carbon-monoxide dehydrogenase large subunit
MLSLPSTLGVKGIGESAIIGATPALADAAPDAPAPLGVRSLDVSLTPDAVSAGLQAGSRRR